MLLLRPRDLGPAPVPVDARAYFSPAQLEKAEDFRRGQLLLFGARLLIELGVLVVLVRKAPPRLREIGERRPVAAAAATAAGISVALGVASLPVGAIARERAKDVGLVTQDWIGFLGDFAKSQAIGAVLGGAGGALLIVGMRRLGRRWWIAGTAVVIAFGVAITYASPIVLDPLFNKFTPLEEGRLRTEVLDLARRAGVDVGQVYVIDASRRTTAANAYVTGIGHTKRVVLYDNLLKDFTPAETRLVVAHELGHVNHDDVPGGLLYLAVVAPFGMFAVARLGERLAGREAPGTAAALPGVLLAVALVAPRSWSSRTSSHARSSAAPTPSRSSCRRAEDADRLPAADRGQERLRPRPAELGDVPARDAPRRRSSGSVRPRRRRGRRRGTGRRGSARSGW